MDSKVLCVALVGGLAATVTLYGDKISIPPPSAKQGVTYEGDIKAIFERSCLKCHGVEKPKGKVSLHTLEATLASNVKNKVFKPGNSIESNIVKSVSRVDEDDAMPPEGKGKPLTAEEIGLIRAWIDQGAK